MADYRIIYVPRLKPAMDWVFGMNWGATTLGSLILSGYEPISAAVLRHELVHIEQWRRYPLGLFGLVYLWAGVEAVLAGGNFYWQNKYEIEARAVSGSS